MREILADIYKHTGYLGFLDVLKISGQSDKTTIESIEKDKLVVLKGQLINAVPEFMGEFGMTNLDLLGQYVGFAPFRADDASIVITKRKSSDGEENPEKLTFKSGSGTEVVYRFINKKLIPQQSSFKGVEWDIVFKPLKQKVLEFSQLAGMLNKYQNKFSFNTDDDNLQIMLGDKSADGHSGSILFSNNISSTVNSELLWPISNVLSILKLGISDEDVKIKISNKGALLIQITSQYGLWDYILPARRK